MGSLYKRGTVWYAKQKVGDKYSYVSLGTKNKREAEKQYNALLAELEAGETAVREVMTPSEAWTHYEKAMSAHLKPHTLYTNKIVWKTFERFLAGRGVTTLQSVRVADVAAWQKSCLDAGRSAAGVNTSMRLCKCVWNHLLRLEELKTPNPFRKVASLRDDRPVKFLPWPTVTGLLDTAKAHGRDIHLVFVLGALAGLRKEEILRVRWEHVDWERGRLFVDGTKTAASRDYVPLHAALREALEPYRKDASFVVMPDKVKSDAPHSYRWSWKRQWNNVVDTYNTKKPEPERVARVTPHMLRHSVATHLYDLGYTLAQIAVFLRHANEIPTRIYAKLRGTRDLDIDRF